MNNIYFLVTLAFAFLFVSCNDDNGSSSQTATLQVRLIDGPGDYDAVNVDIQEIRVNYSGGDEGWQTLDMQNPGVYDLLELTNGASLLLADEELPAGTIQQIRLVLGENNTLVIDDEEVELTTPSAQQSGLKLNIDAELIGGITYELLLDFLVEESIVMAGNSGMYILKPVMRATAVAESGAISGTVTPFDFQVLVSADGVTESSTYVDETSGGFLLSGLAPGDYTVTIEPDADSGYETIVRNNVSVSIGEVTQLGDIAID